MLSALLMHFSKIKPLVKQSGQGQHTQENLLKQEQKIYAKPDPPGDVVFIKVKKHDGQSVKNINNDHHDKAVQGHHLQGSIKHQKKKTPLQ